MSYSGTHSFSDDIRQVKDNVLRCSMYSLLEHLFPGMNVKRRGNMSSPLRDDKNPSFSVYLSHRGYYMAKDFSTGETFDNISLYRAVYPSLSYLEALDRLSLFYFGHGLKINDVSVEANSVPMCISRREHIMQPEQQGALRVLSSVSLLDRSVPEYVKDFWRKRAISDDNISRYCGYVRYINLNSADKVIIDSDSHLPIVDSDGKELHGTPVQEAIGLYNDLGGISLRSPDVSGRKGFKGGTSSFVTTVFADGSRPSYPVLLNGTGDGCIEDTHYNPADNSLWFNSRQCFTNVSPFISVFAVAFVNSMKGKYLDYRDAHCICSVLTSMNGPISGRAVVVEGMFDGLSWIELQGRAGRGFVPGVDLFILNSVSNIKWLAPVLSLESNVRLMLDNDLKSGAGQSAANELMVRVKEFSSSVVCCPNIVSASEWFAPYKDLNDALIAQSGVSSGKHSTGSCVKAFVQMKTFKQHQVI